MASATATLLRAVRAHFSLSQDQLAPWLGVTRRLVTYAERGDRALPTEALLQLTRLAVLLPPAETAPALSEPEPEPAPALLLVPTAALAPLHARLAENAFEATVIQRNLHRQGVQLGMAQRQLAAVEALSAAPAAHSVRDQLWLDLLRVAANRVVAAGAPATLALQHARLAALAAEAAYLRACLAPGTDTGEEGAG